MKRTLRHQLHRNQARLRYPLRSAGAAFVVLPTCSSHKGSVGASFGRVPLPIRITFCPPGVAEGMMTAEMMFPRFGFNPKGRR